MEESNKTKFEDLYLKWNEQGQLKINLQVISMLVKSGLTEKQIAKYYHISIDNLKELKKKYFDFAYAFDKDNIEIMVQTFKTLITLSQGYTKKIPRKQFYKNRKGEEKATITETEVWYEPDLKSITYVLEKFYGNHWRNDSEVLRLAEKKIDDKKEQWINGSIDD